jgi:hypothetical protein
MGPHSLRGELPLQARLRLRSRRHDIDPAVGTSRCKKRIRPTQLVLSRQRRLLKPPKWLPRRCPWRPQERAPSGRAQRFSMAVLCVAAMCKRMWPLGYRDASLSCRAAALRSTRVQAVQCQVVERKSERNRACRSLAQSTVRKKNTHSFYTLV